MGLKLSTSWFGFTGLDKLTLIIKQKHYQNFLISHNMHTNHLLHSASPKIYTTAYIMFAGPVHRQNSKMSWLFFLMNQSNHTYFSLC